MEKKLFTAIFFTALIYFITCPLQGQTIIVNKIANSDCQDCYGTWEYVPGSGKHYTNLDWNGKPFMGPYSELYYIDESVSHQKPSQKIHILKDKLYCDNYPVGWDDNKQDYIMSNQPKYEDIIVSDEYLLKITGLDVIVESKDGMNLNFRYGVLKKSGWHTSRIIYPSQVDIEGKYHPGVRMMGGSGDYFPNQTPDNFSFFDCANGCLMRFNFNQGMSEAYYYQYNKVNTGFVSETIINLYNKSSSPLHTSPGDNSTCQLQADVDCSNPQEKAGRTVRIEFVNQQIGSFNSTEAVTDANGKAYFTYTAPGESALGGNDNIKVEVKAVDVKSGKETYYVPIEIYKRDSKSTFAAEHLIMPQGSKYYNEIKLSVNAPPKGTGYSATISTKDPLGLLTTSKTDPNGSSPVVDNLVPGKVYTLYYHNTGSSTLSAPIEDEITLDVPELNIKKVINVSVGMDLAVQNVEKKYKTGTTYPAVPEPLVISVVDNFHPDVDLEKIFNDFDIKMRVRISPSNVSQTSVMSKVQEDWCSRLLTKFEGFMFGENIVTTSGDAIVTIKKSPEGKYTICKTDREVLPFVMMFDRGTYDFTAELIDIGFLENTNNNSGTVTLSVEQYRDGVDEFLKTALIPIAKSLIDITTGGLMKYGDFAATTADLVLYKDAVSEGKLQDALVLLFGMYCDKLGNTKEFYNVLTKEVKPLTDKIKRLLELNNLSANALDLTKLIVAEAPNKGGGVSSALRDISGDLKYSQLITKGMKDYYFIIMDKSGLKNYSATLKSGSKLLPAADKILNAKSTDERIESDNDYVLIPFENSESASLSLDFSGSGGFLYRVTKDNIDKIEFPKNTSSVKLDISSSGSLSLAKQETKKEEPKTSSFSGSWETADFGTVSFIIAGNDVVGTCTKNLTGMKGKLSSDGTKITGTWAKFPTYSSPNDAGKFEITISSDGKSFTGNWGKGTDSSAKLDKPLNGKKK